MVPFDSMGYTLEIERFENELVLRAAKDTRAASSSLLDPARAKKINHALARVEQALLAPAGLDGRPWYKQTLFAPGRYAGYADEVMAGVSEAVDRQDSVVIRHKGDSVAAALRRPEARLDEVTGLHLHRIETFLVYNF